MTMGLRVPPKMAPSQVVIVPILRDEAGRDEVIRHAQALAQRIQAENFAGEPIRVRVDTRDESPANKRWGWIKKGVPVVVELGARDIASGSVAVTRRDAIGDRRLGVPEAEFVGELPKQLAEIDAILHAQALHYRKSLTIEGIKTYEELVAHFSQEAGTGFVVGKWSGDPDIEDRLSAIGVTIRCLPHAQSGTTGKCLITGVDATLDAVYAKAY